MTETPPDPTRPKSEVSAAQHVAIDTLVASLPNELFPRLSMLTKLSVTIRKRMARELEPMLNEYLKSRSGESLADRRAVEGLVNNVLEDLGLCVTVEGQPALFVAELQDSRRPTSARYAILVPKGNRFTRATASYDVPHLTLDAAPQGIDEILREVRSIAWQSRRY